MFEFKKLTHKDFDDIVDISKDIWGGGDYLPEIFHQWVDDDKGYFLGIVDTKIKKVVSVGKFSVLNDNTGWLEGLRVHTSYRGQKLGRLLSEKLLEIAKEALQNGRINKIAFSSHVSNKESVTLMGKLGFKLVQKQLLVTKEFVALDPDMVSESFYLESWELSYEDFNALELFKRRDNLFPLAFVFQEPTRELFDVLKKDGAFVKINGFRGIVKHKGEVNFLAVDECMDAINAFMNYYLLELQKSGQNPDNTPFTYIPEGDSEMIEQLKTQGYTSWSEWTPDYLYFVYEHKCCC